MPNLIDIIDDAIRDLTEDTTPDINADFLVTSDTSATGPKKVKPVNLLTLYATKNSPVFTGTPTAPTPSPGDNSTKLATTAYVDDAVGSGGGGGASLGLINAISTGNAMP